MITKEQYEIVKIEIMDRLTRVRILKEEQELFIIDNCFKPEYDEACSIASKLFKELQNEEADIKDMLYELYYRYNIQFAKPVPSKPYYR